MKQIGIIGAGQLGQMLGIAGESLGLQCVFLDPAERPPAASVGTVLQYPFDSERGLQQLAAQSDLVTYEFENVPVTALQNISCDTPVYPPAAALEQAQDRLAEKKLFRSIDIPIAEFKTVDALQDLHQAVSDIGLPLVLKTRRFGYDGKGQQIVRTADECEAAVAGLGGKNLIAEQWVPFDRELSIIGTRSVSGDTCVYPLTENEHRDGILHVSKAPAEAPHLEGSARQYLQDLLRQLDYVGTLALELFVVGDRLLANEFAPRVHNSGHWTIEGAKTSQFENHLRAIADLPLGETDVLGFAGMLNLIGTMPASKSCDAELSYLHDYGKSARPGRKLGHITVVRDSAALRDEMLHKLAESLST